jgi:hypothetical protein
MESLFRAEPKAADLGSQFRLFMALYGPQAFLAVPTTYDVGEEINDNIRPFLLKLSLF